MSAEIAQFLDEQGLVKPGMRCVKCRYDLRGQHPAADCPECGRPIRPDLLDHATLDYQRGGHTFLLLIWLVLLPTLPVIAYQIDTVYLGNKDWIGWDCLIYATLASLAAAVLSLLGCFFSVYWAKAVFAMFMFLAAAYFWAIVVFAVVMLFL